MITFQRQIQYDGDVNKATVKSFTLTFHLPIYEYAGVEADTTNRDLASAEKAGSRANLRAKSPTVKATRDVMRRQTSAIESNSVEQALSDKEYRIELKETALAGTDNAQRALAIQYYVRAMLEGRVDDLQSSASVEYLTSDGVEIGGETLDFISLVKVINDAEADGNATTAQRVAFLAVNKTTYAKLRQTLANTSLKGDDNLVLQALSLVTAITADAPTLRDDMEAEFAQWLDGKTGGADATVILATISKAYWWLFNFPLTIPELKTVNIAGVVTIDAPSGTAVTPRDFLDLEITADCSFENEPPRKLSFRFTDPSTIIGNTAAFSLTTAPQLYANGLHNPVVVRVRSLGTDVWSTEFEPHDSKLANLDIRVAKANPTVLTPPKDTRDLATKKLRGRVLTLNKDCPLKSVLVLIQAKGSAEAAWKVVGAAATDNSGNFVIPYPYGKYTQARAMVSISPKEMADIPCTGKDPETIADDFLYLLLTNPDCTPHDGNNHDGKACGGESERPGRLPDHSDLIGSDVYSQDIGGSCVNLSKPNRTISEFNYQAIVRTSDPDVANYTLTRIETGLESVDVASSVALKDGATELQALSTTALTNSRKPLQEDAWSDFQTKVNGACESAHPHAMATAGPLSQSDSVVTASVLSSSLQHVDALIAIISAHKARIESDGFSLNPDLVTLLNSALGLRSVISLAIDTIGTAARYELNGGASLRHRQPISLSNPVSWQDTPETQSESSFSAQSVMMSDFTSRLQKRFGNQASAETPPNATFSQAVTIATGHILHYKAAFKSDGYSLGDLIYSLPLAPGQKKEIVVFEASHSLLGAESQSLAQNERLALGLINERDITNQLAGRISESTRGSSSANTSGISAGFGTAGQGSGGGQGYGGSGGVVIGVAGGVANANSTANQDSSRDVSQFFGEKLRQSIMQNAEGYRQLNASVVTTVQEGQRYGVTSEVVANHNHCHALTMMYFEVLRHYAIFQELASVEECVLVPLLLTRFTTENVARWRDVLAPALLPMPSETYLQPADSVNAVRPHPLLKAFDADQRIRTNYANVDMPAGSYDDERIQFIRGGMRLRVSMPRPRTRFDRIMSLPIITQTLTRRELDPEATAASALEFPRKLAEYATKTAVTLGFNNLFGDRPPDPPGLQYKTIEKEILVREAIFDAFMKLDANYQSVPPAQCVRITNFAPPPVISIGPFGNLSVRSTNPEDFFAENIEDRQLWQAYATLLGYANVLTMLNAHFRGNLISEWDTIFDNDIAPLAFERILAGVSLKQFSIDLASDSKYRGGDRLIRVNLAGTTSNKRNELPQVLKLGLTVTPALQNIKDSITLEVQDLTITYATSHYNGTLFSGSLGDDLLDGTDLFVPENSEEKRNPRREDRYLAAKLIEHLNSNLEYYNKVLWYNLDPDRRYMLLDGFTIQIFHEDGTPINTPDGFRSLATVVKNDVVAVAGNSLVLPVAPGYRVNGSFIRPAKNGEIETVTLFDHYKPITPVDPYRISVPSRGVFAEAVQGVCNACEKIETDRLQDWNRFPNTDEPTPISPITAPTPTVTDWRAAFKDFTTPIVNIQNAPATPSPGEGLQGLAELLGKSGVFKDITGLEGNQQNVIRTYLSNQENAKAFGEMAKEMAMQQHNTQNAGKIMDAIKTAKDSGAISQDEYGKLVKDHLQQQINGGKAPTPALTAGDSQLAAVTADAVRTRTPIEASQTFPDGTVATLKQGGAESGTNSFDFTVPGVTPLQQPSPVTCWAAVVAMMRAWKFNTTGEVTVGAEIAKVGAPYIQLLADGQGLTAANKIPLMQKLGLMVDPIGLSSQMPKQYLLLMQKYGPLWSTVDGNLTAATSPHAKIIYGIRGDGSPDGTMLRIINPSDGKQVEIGFAIFMREFEELARAGNAGNAVALIGQIVRFASPIAAATEGAGSDTVYDVLTRIARDASMGLQANTAAKLMPIPAGTEPYSFDHQYSSGWSGKTVVSNMGLESSALKFPIEHKMAGTTMTMPMAVVDSLNWNNARVNIGADTFALPLTRQFLLAADSGNAAVSMKVSGSAIFPLKATVQSHSTLLFGFVVNVGNGSVVPLDLTNAPAATLETWLGNGGSSQTASNNKRVLLALYDLTLHEPSDDYAPKAPLPQGAGQLARLYPLLSIWSASQCEAVAGDFAMTRPATSTMTEGMFAGSAIHGNFFTDVNETPIRKVIKDLSPFVVEKLGTSTGSPLLDVVKAAALVEALSIPPSPRWNAIFAHYRLASDLPVTKVVDRSKPARTRSGVREVMENDTSIYADTPILKVAGQGAFDNIHMAPNMVYKGRPAAMAPVCQHDCLHLHWRWSAGFTDNYVAGFSDGIPYALAGAPMIPENQDLAVSLAGTTLRYLPVATGIDAGKWQIFMHHGMAYVTELNLPGNRLPSMEANSLEEMLITPPPYEQFYYHNQFLESTGADRSVDKPRVRPGSGRTTFEDAENM